MLIRVLEKAANFLEKKHPNAILCDLEELTEPCTKIFNPKIIVLNNSNEIGLKKKSGEYKSIPFYLSKNFENKFDLPDTLIIGIEGWFTKHLYIKNIDPIIINTCKIPSYSKQPTHSNMKKDQNNMIEIETYSEFTGEKDDETRGITTLHIQNPIDKEN
ncbi:MAG: hypothetical protein ACTSVU_07270 [Promethearchaeota archaeon]